LPFPNPNEGNACPFSRTQFSPLLVTLKGCPKTMVHVLGKRRKEFLRINKSKMQATLDPKATIAFLD